MAGPVVSSLRKGEEKQGGISVKKNKRIIDVEMGKVADNHWKKMRVAPNEDVPRGIQGRVKKRRSGILSHLEPVIEIQREDAFPLGVQALNKYIQDLADKPMAEMQDEDEASGIILKKHQYREIEKIAKTKNEKIGSQFFELFYLLNQLKITNKESGRSIIAFAQMAIESIEDQDVMEVDSLENIEIEEEFREMAQAFITRLPIAISENQAAALALQLQKAARHQVEESEESIISEREEAIDAASVALGYLLLALRHQPTKVIEAVESGDFKSGLKGIAKIVDRILKEAADRILQHREEHARVAIQNADEALFNHLALEMAELSLTESGSLNFGIMEVAAEALIPKHLAKTKAVDNLFLVLEDLASNPALWEAIEKVKPPLSDEVPSTIAIRAFFQLKGDEPITKRHAQKFVLSALLSHLRQARAGTCFTTAILIKALYYFPLFFIHDLASMTEKGHVMRTLFNEGRTFPFIARVSKEYLNVLLQVDADGMIRSTKNYDLSIDESSIWPKVHRGAFLYEAPGLIAACQALGLHDVKGAILESLQELQDEFSVNQLLKKLAGIAFKLQEKGYKLRTNPVKDKKQQLHLAQYAFGIQTNHPLHRAYEQVGTELVNYFGSQYTMPSWVFMTFEKVIKDGAKGKPDWLKRKYSKLITELFLPMITRMRYRYNHHFEQEKKLFDDGNHGVKGSHFYGYQLCDTGLPEDFTYSTQLYGEYKNQSSTIHLARFNQYAPPEKWKTVETKEKFSAFIEDLIAQTTRHLKSNAQTIEEREQWDEAADCMRRKIDRADFYKSMIYRLFGSGRQQKNAFDKNEFNLVSTPWQFAWGGDFNEVYKTFFGFSAEPSQLKPFIGTPKETLAKCINYIKQQPEEQKQDLENPRNQIVVSSPVHAFLLRPFEKTFMQAWQSSLPTNDYIEFFVEKPGMEIAKSRLHPGARKEWIDFVAGNRWVSRNAEKPDWERQQLTQTSKDHFDHQLRQVKGLYALTVEDFQKKLESIVIESRRLDKKINQRNQTWEKRFKSVFNQLVKRLTPNEKDRNRRIDRDTADKLIDFAKNREDSIALSGNSPERFRELMSDVPPHYSIMALREAIVKAAYQARCEYLCGKDPEWLSQFCEALDDKLFKLLPEATKNKLIETGIVTHDTNWKETIHNIHFMFMVNPGTGKIELVRYAPDTQTISFQDQKDWFPKKENNHGYWQFPDNYRQWSKAPLFNVNKYML